MTTPDTYERFDRSFFDRPCQHPGCVAQAVVFSGAPPVWLCLPHHAEQVRLQIAAK